jgi:glutamine amidotransferase
MAKRIAIVDYGLANLQSVVNAIECFTADGYIAERGEDLAGAEKIVLPGVGHFDEGMRGLRARGHESALHERVRKNGVPLLGICLGFQFLFASSEEGVEAGLGWIADRVIRIPDSAGKIPHMGWSEVAPRPSSRLFAGIDPPVEFYFVHSYCAPDAGEVAHCATGLCEYGIRFVAALERDNIFGTQFHPEKSQLAGMRLLETFLAL